MNRGKAQSLGKIIPLLVLCVTIPGTLRTLAQAQSNKPAASPQTSSQPRPAAGSAGGFQQLMKDRLAGDFIQDRYYRFREADGLWIPYSIFVPRNYDKSKKYPLIVMLHGLNITAVQQIRFEGVAELAEKYGYIVVCPTGYSVRSFWGIRSQAFRVLQRSEQSDTTIGLRSSK